MKKDLKTAETRRLDFTSIIQGQIPDAMQWKRAAVFAADEANATDLLSYLHKLTETKSDLDSVRTLPSAGLPENGEIHVYFLYGWSPSGADELRSASLDSALISGQEIRIYVSRPVIQTTGYMAGTADMRFIGWDVTAGRLDAGEYSAKLYVQRDTVKVTAKPYSKVVLSGRGYTIAREMTMVVGKSD